MESKTMESKRILITSALPYVNNVPHLGNIIGCVLSADVYSRFCRMRKYETLFICGTDEYGTSTEIKAKEEKISSRDICDKYHKIHKDIYDKFLIKFDNFGRTSTSLQTEIVHDIFQKLEKNELINEKTVKQFYCEGCDIFLADRYIIGKCPICLSESSGGQCDKCHKLIDALQFPLCSMCHKEPIIKYSKHLFLNLEKMKKEINKWFLSKKIKWDKNVENITKSFIHELKNKCITRDLKWGVKVPKKEFEDKVFYVWFDAPIGYISITAKLTEHWKKWWKESTNTKLVQFMGKDNILFHTVIFPATLLGTKDGYNLINNLNISATHHLLYENNKFSKSKKIGIFCDDLDKYNIPIDTWRYYLLINRPEKSDFNFSLLDLKRSHNKELLMKLGNFIYRVLSFIIKRGNKIIIPAELLDIDREYIKKISIKIQLYIDNLEELKIKSALKVVMSIVDIGNKYFQANKPWKKEDANNIISICCSTIKIIGILLFPYMPSVSTKIFEQLNIPKDFSLLNNSFLIMPENHSINTPFCLFQKLT